VSRRYLFIGTGLEVQMISAAKRIYSYPNAA
jgi:hypothetical protein